MLNVSDILKNAAHNIGLNRERYGQSPYPDSIKDVVVLLFLGDINHVFISSSWITKRYKEEYKSSKYFILISWPGLEGVFPYVDEYWSLNSCNLYSESKGFTNSSLQLDDLKRKLNWHFEEVIYGDYFEKFYHNGLKKEFLDSFKHIRTFLPTISSAAILGKNFIQKMSESQGHKVFIWPSKYIFTWKKNQVFQEKIPEKFWQDLIDYLLSEKFQPVIWNGFSYYEMSDKFLNKCIYVKDSMKSTLAAVRACDCVLDVYNGLSNLAIWARTPYLSVVSRSLYYKTKRYEIDDLCGDKIPKKQIFHNSDFIKQGIVNHGIFSLISQYLNKQCSSSNKDNWKSSEEFDTITPYAQVRKMNFSKKIGAKFIKIQRI